MTESLNELMQEMCVEETRRDDILCRAADRRLPVMLTRFDYTGWSCLSSRFAGYVRYDELIYFARPEPDTSDDARPLRVGERVGVSFRRGRTKCLFTSIVTACDCDEPSIELRNGLALRWPDELQVMQRRLYERVAPPNGACVSVAVWPGAGRGDETSGPGARQHRPPVHETVDGLLENLSAGGMGLYVNRDMVWQTGDTLRCGFTPRTGSDPLHLDVRLRHIAPHSDGGYSLGFQFLGLESSTTGRCRLAQLASVVSQYRRARVAARVQRLPARRTDG